MTEIKMKLDLPLIRVCIDEGAIIDEDLMFADLSYLGDVMTSKCEPSLGDGRKSWQSQYYCITREGRDYVCIGRTGINGLGNASGGFMKLPKGEFEKWVLVFTSENMYPYVDLPQETAI